MTGELGAPPIEEGGRPARVVAIGPQVERRLQHGLHAHLRVEGERRLQAAEEDRGAAHQEQRGRDLRRAAARRAGSVRTAAGVRPAGPSTSPVAVRVNAWTLVHRGDDPDGDDRRGQRDGKSSGVDAGIQHADAHTAWQLERPERAQQRPGRSGRPRAPPAPATTAASSAKPRDEPCRRGAKSEAGRELGAPRLDPDEQQQRHGAAADEQRQRHGRRQEPRERHQPGLRGPCPRRDVERRESEPGLRAPALEPGHGGRKAVQAPRRLRRRDAVAQASDDADTCGGRADVIGFREIVHRHVGHIGDRVQRDEDVGRTAKRQAAETWRDDADDRGRRRAEPDRPAHDPRVRGEDPAPGAIGQQCPADR